MVQSFAGSWALRNTTAKAAGAKQKVDTRLPGPGRWVNEPFADQQVLTVADPSGTEVHNYDA